MSEIIGKYFTWRNCTIYFDRNGIVSAPWCLGTYKWLDHNNVKIVWGGIESVATFNPIFTEFVAVTEKSDEVIKSTLVNFAKDSKIPSIHIDYKEMTRDLCFLMKKYNIDKSSQRDNPGYADSNHCHSYSLLYDYLFKNTRHQSLNFCEIGIAEGRSLLMWNEYFPNSEIYGFDYLPKFVDGWNEAHSDIKRVHVNYIDVRTESKIIEPLTETGVLFDCIIDDSSHMFYDIIRIIKSAKQFLKPGGMMIIEDIRTSFDESWFYNDLKEVLSEFETVYFVTLDHSRRNSGVVRNDKVLILVNKGEPIFNSVL
jgi:SAM-dependent methyltransferase